MGFYYPGETIHGTINFKVEKPFEFQVITLRFRGESRVSWIQGAWQGSSEEFKDSEVYFDDCTSLLTATDTENTLLSGEFQFPFEFQLPVYLPPTVAKYHGGVWYYMKIKIHVNGWKVFKSGLTAMRSFRVSS